MSSTKEAKGSRGRQKRKAEKARPPELAPADLLVSRISREIDKRMLSIKEVFQVRTQAHQLRASRKHTRVGEGIEKWTWRMLHANIQP